MGRLRSTVVAIALATTALLAGCGSPGNEHPATPTTEQSSATQPDSAGIASPAEVDIPKIEARSSLVELGLNADQTVQVPPVETPMQAGWFTGAPKPGEPGPAVVLGHVNGGGQAGIFAKLHELAAGDEVLIKRTDGTTARFTVNRVDQVSKDHFPTDEVYGNTEGPELRLITCGGAFDRSAHSYEDNVIVYATLA